MDAAGHRARGSSGLRGRRRADRAGIAETLGEENSCADRLRGIRARRCGRHSACSHGDAALNERETYHAAADRQKRHYTYAGRCHCQRRKRLALRRRRWGGRLHPPCRRSGAAGGVQSARRLRDRAREAHEGLCAAVPVRYPHGRPALVRRRARRARAARRLLPVVTCTRTGARLCVGRVSAHRLRRLRISEGSGAQDGDRRHRRFPACARYDRLPRHL